MEHLALRHVATIRLSRRCPYPPRRDLAGGLQDRDAVGKGFFTAWVSLIVNAFIVDVLAFQLVGCGVDFSERRRFRLVKQFLRIRNMAWTGWISLTYYEP